MHAVFPPSINLTAWRHPVTDKISWYISYHKPSSGRLTQQCEGSMLAVSSQQVAAVSGELIQNPVKGVNVVSSKQAASAWRACHQSCPHKLHKHTSRTLIFHGDGFWWDLKLESPVRCRRSKNSCSHFFIHTWNTHKHTLNPPHLSYRHHKYYDYCIHAAFSLTSMT